MGPALPCLTLSFSRKPGGSPGRDLGYICEKRPIQTDIRMLELFAEVDSLRHWDVVMLSETWREQKEEQFETDKGSLVCGRSLYEGSE